MVRGRKTKKLQIKTNITMKKKLNRHSNQKSTNDKETEKQNDI